MLKNTCFIILATVIYVITAKAEIAWENPAVLCPEEILPRGLDCLDLSGVADPQVEFPSTLSKEEISDWTNNKTADLRLCRNMEVLNREKINPGTFSENNLKAAWMVVNGAIFVKEKLDAIIAASVKYGIPPQILIGALKQESGLSTIGVAPDGGNYSCGMAQMNIQEWCESINQLPKEKRDERGWPVISCDEATLPTDAVKPFYEMALKRNTGIKQSYQMLASDYDGITAVDVGMEENLFLATYSFLHHCQDFSLSIDFKARILKNLFDHFVPKSLREAELYSASSSFGTFPRHCERAYPVAAYPLHTGWLLAVAMYNAGPVQAKLIGHYYHVVNNEFPLINPLGLIEALYWGGKWKAETDSIIFYDQNGKEFTQRWYKSCVVQKHVARVIQHVTIFSENIARSLDLEGCKNVVPENRQISSGVKD
ncbi:MAG: hypothetical protein PHY93_07295 [Bacteriovorax sp.]|nr:hypothetical protein [Bacteriovorax sp.]